MFYFMFAKYVDGSSIDNRTRLVVTIFDEPSAMFARIETGGPLDKDIPTGAILDPSQVTGYIADLASAVLQKKLKVPYKFVVERAYGIEMGEGRWNGLIGALMNRSADLAMAPLVITRKRAAAVDFSYPFLASGISLMMLKPNRLKPVRWHILLRCEHFFVADSTLRHQRLLKRSMGLSDYFLCFRSHRRFDYSTSNGAQVTIGTNQWHHWQQYLLLLSQSFSTFSRSFFSVR